MDDAYRLLERKCWRKKAYSTSRAAQRKIQELYRKKHQRLYKYKCSTCGWYHLTKSISAKGQIL